MEPHEIKCEDCGEWTKINNVRDILRWAFNHGTKHTPEYKIYRRIREKV